MVRTFSRPLEFILIGLLTTQLSACLDQANWERWKGSGKNNASPNSFITSITFDNEDNLYIATVSGKILRYDGRHLTEIISGPPHGLGIAKTIRFAQNHLYIHYKHYINKDTGYSDDMMLFSVGGEYIEQLFSRNVVAHLLHSSATTEGQVLISDTAVNHFGQLYTLAKPTALLRINYDKQNLIRIAPQIDKAVIEENKEYLSQVYNLDLSNYTDLEETQGLPELPDFYLDGLTSIATDAQNNIYIGCILGVFKFDTEGNYLKSIAVAGKYNLMFPHSLAIDPSGNIIIANYYQISPARMEFIKFDANGNYMGIFIPAGTAGLGIRVDDMMFDHAGNLYIVDTIKGIYKFDSTGQFTKIIIKPFT